MVLIILNLSSLVYFWESHLFIECIYQPKRFVIDGFQALLAPAIVIGNNAGVDGTVVVEKIRTSDWEMGYNAMTDKYEDLFVAGVVDSCRVSTCALQNAVSVASVVLTTQAVVVEKIRKPKPLIPHVPGITGQ